MIRGAHVIVYSEDAEADLAFLRDVLDFPGGPKHPTALGLGR